MSTRAQAVAPPPPAAPDDAPFTDPSTWAPWGHKPVTIPMKVALDAHGALVAKYGHAGAFHCGCPLARAIKAWGEPVQA